MPWILPFLHLTREVNGWRDLWAPLDGAIGDRDGALLNVSGGDGQGVSGVRSSGALYDTQVTRAHACSAHPFSMHPRTLALS